MALWLTLLEHGRIRFQILAHFKSSISPFSSDVVGGRCQTFAEVAARFSMWPGVTTMSCGRLWARD